MKPPKWAQHLRSNGPGPVLNWAGVLIGIVGSIVTIVTAIVSVHRGLTSWQLTALLMSIMAGYVVVVIYLVRANGKSVNTIGAIARQQESTTLMLKLAHDLNDVLAEFGPSLSTRDLLQFVKSSCKQMASAFSSALGVECRVCVKEIVDAATDRPQVRAIERSDRRVGPSEVELHHIDENTDFNELYTEGEKVWFSNDVTIEPRYRNSSANRKYRATIVWPVITRAAQDPGTRFAPIAAFLCIDSDVAGIFSRDLHVPLGWTVADALARAFETVDPNASKSVESDSPAVDTPLSRSGKERE